MFKELTYLYIEDDPMSRDVINIVLSRVLGIENVWIFEDSTDFLERTRALPKNPDVFLLDIHMEPITGFKMLEILRADEDYKDAIIIALTASVMNEEVELLKTSGFNAVIAKPIDIETFPSLIERIIQGEELWHISE